jgi:MFS transporter, NNP family, nitrate/nitrite transporter
MPLFFDALVKLGHPKFTAWRWAFYLPAALHLLAGAAVFLFGQDVPAGRTADIKQAGGVEDKKNSMTWPAWRAAVLNYRTWALTAVYSVTFGVGEFFVCAMCFLGGDLSTPAHIHPQHPPR